MKEALDTNKENDDTFWFDAIAKEMKNVKVAFKILDDDKVIPVGCRLQPIPCHLIFNVKMDFTHKARYVVGGHVTAPLRAST